MKKLIAILLVVIMMFSLTACKSKEQKAADQFLKDLEELGDEIIAAIEDEDLDKLNELMEEFEEMGEDYEDIYDALEEKDEDAAEQFESDVEDLGNDIVEELENLY